LFLFFEYHFEFGPLVFAADWFEIESLTLKKFTLVLFDSKFIYIFTVASFNTIT